MTLQEACEIVSEDRMDDQRVWVDLTGDSVMLNLIVNGRLVCFWVHDNTVQFEDWDKLRGYSGGRS